MKFPIVNGTYDQAARESFKVNPASAFSWVMAASYCYYHLYESILEDTTFDRMMKFLLDNYDNLEHTNKSLITKDMLAVGSLYNLSVNDYPLRVKVSADELLRNLLTWKATNGENQK